MICERLEALGQLIAQQAEAFAVDEQNEMKYGETCEGLPSDIINFQHDPLACAIALGWNEGVEIEELPLLLEEKDGWLHERIDPSGKPVRVVTKVDGPRFNEFWLNKIIEQVKYVKHEPKPLSNYHAQRSRRLPRSCRRNRGSILARIYAA